LGGRANMAGCDSPDSEVALFWPTFSLSLLIIPRIRDHEIKGKVCRARIAACAHSHAKGEQRERENEPGRLGPKSSVSVVLGS
jgi:hypothetical protein